MEDAVEREEKQGEGFVGVWELAAKMCVKDRDGKGVGHGRVGQGCPRPRSPRSPPPPPNYQRTCEKCGFSQPAL